MAHEVETMAYANQVPWHGLGAKVDDSLNAGEFLKAAGLDWTVDLKPLKADYDGELIDVPGRYALVRSSDRKVMTVTGQFWKPVQNSEAIGFMQRYVNAGGAKLETAGSLRGGRYVWGLAKIERQLNIRRNDTINCYLLIVTSHVVGEATKIKTTTVRVVCANTMAMAERDGQYAYRQNHLSEFDESAAREAVAAAHEDLDNAERRAKKIDKLKLTVMDAVNKVLVPVMAPEMVEDFTSEQELFDAAMNSKKIEQIVDSIQNGPGAIPDTGWGVLNGFTHWCDHVQGRGNESRLFRSWLGDYSRAKQEVEKKLFEMA
jgi:phage/plasmid-like protein (TIGR03299 family)